ncbi:hypothetical protein F5B20DRAFT_586306 [Whalleya microplaca]|nr:hypothetical protein F5B20DRAFT_586306 [Whalleya microplaca]
MAATSFAGVAQEQMRAHAINENTPTQQQPSRYRGTRDCIARNNRQQQQQNQGPGYGYGYGHPVYVHQHAECPHCYYRSLNLQKLRALHAQHSLLLNKSPRARDAEVGRLYAYYVSRVRDAFEDHRRLVPGLYWEPPERDVDERELVEQAHVQAQRAQEDKDKEGEEGEKGKVTGEVKEGEVKEGEVKEPGQGEVVRLTIPRACQLRSSSSGADDSDGGVGTCPEQGSLAMPRPKPEDKPTTAEKKKGAKGKGKGKARRGRGRRSSSLSDCESYECGEDDDA